MKAFRNIGFIISISVIFGLVSRAGVNAPEALKTEMLVNPVGLHSDPPRFSWIMEDTARGAKQMAYHIQVASMPDRSNF